MTDSTAALGQLWSTTGDLARWGAFIAEGRDGVLDRTTLDEMARVQAMADHARWTVGWGLGFELFRLGERVLVGHGGAMPGFLAGLAVERAERTGAAVLTSASTGAKGRGAGGSADVRSDRRRAGRARGVAPRRRAAARRRATSRQLVDRGKRARRLVQRRPLPGRAGRRS